MASQAKSLRISNIQIEVRRWGAYEGKACNIVTKGFGDQTEFSVGTPDVGGRISGQVSDPSGAFVAATTVTLTNIANGTRQTTITNGQGQYSFLVVPIGRYELEIVSPGFQPYRKTGIVIDVNSALQIDATLQIKNSETWKSTRTLSRFKCRTLRSGRRLPAST
jgi:Carboxypeptidase regulatory-like domain